MARAKKKPSFAKQLKEIVNEIPEEQRVFGEKLAAEIEWMAGTLTELKNIVDEQGAVITTTNGNGFEVMTENPAQKTEKVIEQCQGRPAEASPQKDGALRAHRDNQRIAVHRKSRAQIEPRTATLSVYSSESISPSSERFPDSTSMRAGS